MAVSEGRSNLQMEEPEINSSENNDASEPRLQLTTKLRNLSAFWLLGLCNNFSYVVMLSAAHDILAADFNPADKHNGTLPTIIPLDINNTRDCNKMSTGAILLADVLPSLCIKMVAPFIGISTSIRIVFVVGLCAASLLIVALSTAHWVTFLGVVCASFSGGLGETTFLGYSAYFDRNVVSTWSSGTGGSGIFGALSYAAMTTAGISSRTTLLIMLIIPIVMTLSFWVLLVHPSGSSVRHNTEDEQPLLVGQLSDDQLRRTSSHSNFTSYVTEKWNLIKPLSKYAVPLMLVYIAEYFINQGLVELIYFKGIWLSHKEQYRWFQVDYQLGVFLSRSSVNLFTINKLWLLPILQFLNVMFFLTEMFYPFLPSIWIVFGLILFEGLLGGAAYVNTYYKMAKEIAPHQRSFSMAFVPLADSFGVALAGGIALPVHDYFCKLPLRT